MTQLHQILICKTNDEIVASSFNKEVKDDLRHCSTTSDKASNSTSARPPLNNGCLFQDQYHYHWQ